MISSTPADRPRLAATLLLLGLLVPHPALHAQPRDDDRFPVFYFDMLGYTEAWLNLVPPSQPGEQTSPITLNMTVRYRGKPADGPLITPPIAIIVRAESNPLYNPMFLRQPILTMHADGQALWDPALRVNFSLKGVAICDGCVVDVVEVITPEDVLRRMASARAITGNAFGLTFMLSADQITIIRLFVEQVFGPPQQAGSLDGPCVPTPNDSGLPMPCHRSALLRHIDHWR